jgi:hypothetical protein
MDTPTKTFDPLTATLGEVLDLLERDGWTKWMAESVPDLQLGWSRNGENTTCDPITIDRVAGMLPGGWKWISVEWTDKVWAGACNTGSHEYVPVFAYAENELEARARVVAAVLMREGK